MARVVWAVSGERFFEAGVDQGMFYPMGGQSGVAWSGLVSVTESPTGGEPRSYYMDGIKYQNRPSNEEFSGTLEAFTYPPEFAEYDGTKSLAQGFFAAHQRRKPFGLSYRTRIGNDVDGDAYGYKIHLLYNVLAAPSEKNNETLQDNAEATTFSWSLTTTPIQFSGTRPTAHYVIDSTKTHPSILAAVENLLYGSPANQPYLPDPLELLTIFTSAAPDAPFVVTDLGNGMFSISGSDQEVKMLDANHFQLSSQYVLNNGNGSYTATTGVSDDPDGPVIPFTVEQLGNGLFKVTGPAEMVKMVSETRFQLSAPFVTNNGDGSYDVTSE